MIKLVKDLTVNLLIVSSFFVCSQALADECDGQFANKVGPQFVVKKYGKDGIGLCFNEYVAYASGVTKSSMWVAEYLTKSRIDFSQQMERVDSFHEEMGIPKEYRARLKDYSRSGYDRGHLAPNGDMSNKEAQHESFSLVNMIPQNPDLNRGLWAKIESSVRQYAQSEGAVYVVTGPAYIGRDLDSLKGRVLVPTHVWKAIYDPATKRAGAYWVPNQDVDQFETISIAELETRTGINAFPSLSRNIKETAMRLPEGGSHIKYKLTNKLKRKYFN